MDCNDCLFQGFDHRCGLKGDCPYRDQEEESSDDESEEHEYASSRIRNRENC